MEENKTNENVNATSTVNEIQNVNGITPNHTIKYKKFKNQLQIKVVLHKIPPQMINFDPTETHFHLDTLKYNKKYVLDFPYPYAIKVDIKEGEEPQADFAHGVLTANLPIKVMDEKLLPKRETQEERKKRLANKRKEKAIREKEVLKTEKNQPKTKKQKTKRNQNETKHNPPKKRTTTQNEDLDIAEQINQKLDQVREKKIEKDENKLEWENKQLEKKQKKQEKEKKVISAIRESVIEKMQDKGKFKNLPLKKAPPKKIPPKKTPSKKTSPKTNVPSKKTPKNNTNKKTAPKKVKFSTEN